jgi:hypothetical protein
VDELPHGAGRHPELLRNLLLAAALDGDGQQRLALALRQGGEPGERVPHERAALGELGRPADAFERLPQLVVVVPVHAQRVQRGVVDDPVEPGAQVVHVVAAAEARPRRHEPLLQGVLRPRLRQDPADVAQERPAVALHDGLEGPLVARGGEGDEALVALGAQEGDGRHDHGATW